jgi:hypothetical protein
VILQATAPVAFGFASEHLPGASSGGPPGLEYTLVLFLAVLLLVGLAILPALRTYSRDVATADASIHAVAAVARRTGPAQAALPLAGRQASPSASR